jgi:hypothetical protein
MKRRSPWLTFAACVLLRGSSAHAEPTAKPVLSISKASSVAEAELEKRGLANDHVISSVVLVRAEGKPAYYSARIEPPIPATAVKDTPAPPAGAEKTEDASVAFKIEMNGTVSVTQEPQRRRIRVVNPISK